MGGAMRKRRAAMLQPSGNLGSGAGRWTETVGGPKSLPWFPGQGYGPQPKNQIPSPGELESVSPGA